MLKNNFHWNNYEEFLEYLGWPREKDKPWNIEAWSDYQLMMTYLEGVGMLVKNNLIDINMVHDLLADRITYFYETHKSIMDGSREVLKDPTLYDSFEYLYQELRKRKQQSTLNIT